MKFAPHIGLSSPDDLMFPASAGSDPIDQIKFIMETGNIIENIDRVENEIALFEIADAPKRTEPNSGEMNYTAILKHIKSKGYKGLIEMEHSVSQPGKLGEEKVLEIYEGFKKL